jgi:hypothetical protein
MGPQSSEVLLRETQNTGMIETLKTFIDSITGETFTTTACAEQF